MPTFGVTYTGNYEFPQPLHERWINSRPTPVSTSTCTSTLQRWLPGTVRRPGYRLGLPPARVKSISASGHKFGLAPLGCGGLSGVTKKRCRRNWCSTLTTGWSNWYFCHQLLPPGGSGNAQYYEFLRLGREGYTKVQNALTRLPLIWRMKSPNWGRMSYLYGSPGRRHPGGLLQTERWEDPGYTLYDLSERLRLRGWQFRPSLSAVKPPTSW